MKRFALPALCAALALALVGCSAATPAQSQTDRRAESAVGSETLSLAAASESEAPLRAMLLSQLDGAYLLVVQETEVPFTSPLSAEIYGLNGEELAASDLSAGDIVDVYGDGAMTRSYPAQYPGVQKVQLVSEGTPEDAAPYQSLLSSSASASPEAETSDAGVVNRAMVIPYGEDGILFVDQDTGTPFTATLPEAIYGLDGAAISAKDLARGNIVEITGNGILLESYPGQYPGVTKIQVVSAGAPEDADPYQEIVDSFYAEPDSSQPASLQLEYCVPGAAVVANATRGSYEWETSSPDDPSAILSSCSAHVLQWTDMLTLNLEEPTEVTLHFFPSAATSVRVVRWPESLFGTQDLSAAGEGEAVSLSDGEGVFTLTAEPGFLYGVYADFDLGSVEYGFGSGSLPD